MVEYQRGDVSAFERLYALLRGPLSRHLESSACGGVAPDLVQATFLEMHRSRHTYRPPLPMTPGACVIARTVPMPAVLRDALRLLPVGALYGRGAGHVADSGLRLFCWVSDPLHVVLSHGGAIAALAGAGALVAVLGDRARSLRVPS